MENNDIVFTQSQKHGFIWENEIKKAVFGIEPEQNNTDKYDVPCEKNKLDSNENISIKTVASNTIWCSDILKFYDYNFENGKKNTMIVITWKQDGDSKIIVSNCEINYNQEMHKECFGDVTRTEIKDYVAYIKSIPHGKTSDQIKNIYKEKKNILQKKNSMKITINPKVDTKKQRRVQCSIPNFEKLLKKFITYQSQDKPNSIRGQEISLKIKSSRRKIGGVTKNDLIKICKENKEIVKGYSKMKKQELIELLKQHNLMPKED